MECQFPFKNSLKCSLIHLLTILKDFLFVNREIIWKKLIPVAPLDANGQAFYPLFAQRTTAHFPHPAICTLVAKSLEGDQTYIHSFNPITGSDVASKKLDFQMIQATVLSEMDANHVKGVVIIDKSLKVVILRALLHSFLTSFNSHATMI